MQDFECFTILEQGSVPGLQILSQGGEWILAPPIPGTMVVNIADCLSTWLENSRSDSILLIDEYRTNKKFKSTIHRVTNLSGEERYSIPFFFGIDYDATVSVLENHTSIDNPPCTAPFKAGEVCDKLNCYLLRQLLTIHPSSGSVIKLLMPMFLSKAKYASHWHPQYISEHHGVGKGRCVHSSASD